MAASTIVPIAIAIPPKLIILAETPIFSRIINAPKIPKGNDKIATNAERMCIKKSKQIRPTTIISSINLLVRVATARSIKLARL